MCGVREGKGGDGGGGHCDRIEGFRLQDPAMLYISHQRATQSVKIQHNTTQHSTEPA